jgi:hypothetical protein
VGIAVGDDVIQVRTTRSGVEVGRHDGRALDAVVRAGAEIVLGLAAGAFTIDDAPGPVEVDGDPAVVHALFDRR